MRLKANIWGGAPDTARSDGTFGKSSNHRVSSITLRGTQNFGRSWSPSHHSRSSLCRFLSERARCARRPLGSRAFAAADAALPPAPRAVPAAAAAAGCAGCPPSPPEPGPGGYCIGPALTGPAAGATQSMPEPGGQAADVIPQSSQCRWSKRELRPRGCAAAPAPGAAAEGDTWCPGLPPAPCPDASTYRAIDVPHRPTARAARADSSRHRRRCHRRHRRRCRCDGARHQCRATEWLANVHSGKKERRDAHPSDPKLRARGRDTERARARHEAADLPPEPSPNQATQHVAAVLRTSMIIMKMFATAR